MVLDRLGWPKTSLDELSEKHREIVEEMKND